MESHMEWESILIKLLNTMETTLKAGLMVSDIIETIDYHTLGNGNMVKDMVKVFIHTLMASSTLVAFITINGMDLEV